MIVVYWILGILGFCFLLVVLYQCCKISEVAEYDDHQENRVKQDNNMEPSIYSLGVPSENQNERQENNSFNPTFNPIAKEMPANPEYEARNNLPSNFQTNTYGENNHITSTSNLPYSLTPGEGKWT